MSVMGTGVAAGVAQTGLTSQQVARQRDKQDIERRRQLQQLQDRYLGQLDGPEVVESTDADNTAHSQPEGARHPETAGGRHTPHADPETTEAARDAADRVDLARQPIDPAAAAPGGASNEPAATDPAAKGDPGPAGDAPLYRHLDVRA